MGIRGELYSSKFASEGRTYFFNIKQNRMGDVFLSIVESKPTEGEMFDRRAIVVFGDQMGGFLDAFRDALKHMDKIGNKVDPLDFSAVQDDEDVRPARARASGGKREGHGPREGGFKPRESGFKSRDEGGFKPRGEGGFKPRGEGGFKPRGEGGFKPREGGFKPRGEGGFKPREGGRDRDQSAAPRAYKAREPRAPRRDDRAAPPSGGKRIVVRRKKES